MTTFDIAQAIVGLLLVGSAIAVLRYLDSEDAAMRIAALRWGGACDSDKSWFCVGWRDARNGTTDNKPFEWQQDMTREQMAALCAYNSGVVASRAYPRPWSA